VEEGQNENSIMEWLGLDSDPKQRA